MRELKCWCLSQLQGLEVRLAGEPSSTELPVSSSAATGLEEDEGAAPQGPGEPSEAEAGAASHSSVLPGQPLPGNLIHETGCHAFVSWQRPASPKRLQLQLLLARSEILSFIVQTYFALLNSFTLHQWHSGALK